ncbi:MAG: methyltransferase [Planctomycetia bacterium]
MTEGFGPATPIPPPHPAADESSAGSETILRLLSGAWAAQAISVAAELRVADRLADGPQPLDALATAVAAHPDALHRLLRTLTSIGVFAEPTPGVYALTPLSNALRTNVPHSVRAMARVRGGEQQRAWGELLYSVRTGQPAFDKVFGRPMFDYFAVHPEAGALFDAAMTSIHGRETAGLLTAYDLSRHRTLVDVGGGNGSTLIEILRSHPHLRGVVYDRPEVADRTAHRLEAAGLADRAHAVGGDFFADVPAEGDVYLMRHILHDWDDAACHTILKNCRAGMPEGGVLLIVEFVIAEGDAPAFGKWLDLAMLVLLGGRERTESDFRRLLHETGFTLTAVHPTDAGVVVVEARPN